MKRKVVSRLLTTLGVLSLILGVGAIGYRLYLSHNAKSISIKGTSIIQDIELQFEKEEKSTSKKKEKIVLDVDLVSNLQNVFKNKDVIGYIYYPSANISYPIVQGSNNDKYLHQDAYGNSSMYGSIFLDVNNSPDFSDGASVLYGHHMRDGSMFGSLESALSSGINGSNFVIYTRKERLKYNVVSTEVINQDKAGSGYYIAKGKEDLQGIKDTLKKNHKFLDNSYSEGNNFITLVTCHYVGSKTVRFGATASLSSSIKYTVKGE